MSDQPSTSPLAVVPVAEQVAQANDSGRVPVAFIHGLWLLPSSRDRWAAMFAEAGDAPVSPGWPDDPDTVAEANADPGVFANKTIGMVADHYSQVIGTLTRKPAVIAHLRRPGRPDHRRARPVSRDRGDRRRAVPRRAAAAAVLAEGRLPGPGEPGQPAPRRPAVLRPVPVQLRQRGQRGRSAAAV